MVGEQKFKLRAFKCKSLVPFLQSRDLNKIKLIHFFSILKLHNYNCSIVGCFGCKQTTLMCIWAYYMSKYYCMIVRFSINHTFSHEGKHSIASHPTACRTVVQCLCTQSLFHLLHLFSTRKSYWYVLSVGSTRTPYLVILHIKLGLRHRIRSHLVMPGQNLHYVCTVELNNKGMFFSVVRCDV